MNNNKPLMIAIEEAEQNLFATANGILNSGVPCYFLAPIAEKLYHQLLDGAKREMAQLKANYEQSLEKEQEPKEEVLEEEPTLKEG